MRPSAERTQRMEQILTDMRNPATASYPLLDELAKSPSPGERLAAVAVLQVFADEQYLPFLVKLVGSEKPFGAYHAITALRFAVGALDPRAYPRLLESIREAQSALTSADAAFGTDRQTVLREAEQALQKTIQALGARADISSASRMSGSSTRRKRA